MTIGLFELASITHPGRDLALPRARQEPRKALIDTGPATSLAPVETSPPDQFPGQRLADVVQVARLEKLFPIDETPPATDLERRRLIPLGGVQCKIPGAACLIARRDLDAVDTIVRVVSATFCPPAAESSFEITSIPVTNPNKDMPMGNLVQLWLFPALIFEPPNSALHMRPSEPVNDSDFLVREFLFGCWPSAVVSKGNMQTQTKNGPVER